VAAAATYLLSSLPSPRITVPEFPAVSALRISIPEHRTNVLAGISNISKMSPAELVCVLILITALITLGILEPPTAGILLAVVAVV
jgi:hypothetical protein